MAKVTIRNMKSVSETELKRMQKAELDGHTAMKERDAWRVEAETAWARVKSAEASNQQLSQAHLKIENVAKHFAKTMERDGETISILTRLLNRAVESNTHLQELIDHSFEKEVAA